ncbi:hypothetical protein NE235_28035 [Actinoallomurus spadix]|uniref:Ribosomal protein L7/L12 C-terminal domain-containing protein n=1 Tax=Actinoallomurus spadix TaxID=79912 RepID=A0ABP3FGZ4_9ACTN|nr:hypothetical protein [Actinoallomurus spadix]MCO5989970.1 hypothetical protein [Actinoallomurus spadix]
MTVVTVVIIVAVVLVAVVGAARKARPKGEKPMPKSEPPLRLSAELEGRVRALLAEDQTVQAVKEVRQATGLGLLPATRLVNGLRDEPRL